jgi:hypothetical protein
MGSFAETSIIDYHLSFGDQGKQTFVFPFPFTARQNGSLPFLFSVCRKQMGVAVFRKFCIPFVKFQKNGDMDMESWRHWPGDIDMETWNFNKLNGKKRKPR